jgi:hypothetical protein
MSGDMPDSRLNRAERALQQSFMKSAVFNGLFVGVAVMAVYGLIRPLPDRDARPPAQVALRVEPVFLPPSGSPLHLAGAWVLKASDARFGGLSALAIDRGRFLSVSDRGAVVRFDLPPTSHPTALVQDLLAGPGDFRKKWARDAESLARDPSGRGWWVGFEQHHSLWLYDDQFDRALTAIDLRQADWGDNRGAEGLLADRTALLVTAENGRDAIEAGSGGIARLDLQAGAEVADAARAPDGSAWLLLRSKGRHGITQSIAPLQRQGLGYRAGPRWPLPKGAFDNYEGMAIEPLPGVGWRFWLVTDDGHRVMARTLLVALDLSRHDKSPATRAGLLQRHSVKRLKRRPT